MRPRLFVLVESSLRTRNTLQLNLQSSLSLIQLRHGGGSSRDMAVGLNLHWDSSFISISGAER